MNRSIMSNESNESSMSRRRARTAARPAPSRAFALAAILSPSLLAPALAAERELGAHEHGAALLGITLDGERLYVDLDTPADNVLGFEHAPSSDAQRETLAAARRELESGALFVPAEAAGCTLESGDADIELAEGDGEAHAAGEEHGHDEDEEHAAGEEHGHGEDEEHAAGEEHGHDEDGEHAAGEEHGHGEDGEHAAGEEHGHDEDGEHAAGEEHGHDEHEEHAGEGTHSDIVASYVYLCDDPSALDVMATTLFETFEGFEEIDVQLVGPGGQGAAELTPGNAAIALEPIR